LKQIFDVIDFVVFHKKFISDKTIWQLSESLL